MYYGTEYLLRKQEVKKEEKPKEENKRSVKRYTKAQLEWEEHKVNLREFERRQQEVITTKTKKKRSMLHCNYPPIELMGEMIKSGERSRCNLGYVYIKWGKYKCYEHRLVVRMQGIEVSKGYSIHHIDKNKTNNRPENLIVLHWKEHQKQHSF